MKLEFNPKVTANNEKGTIYLLDEPGSYLHYSAQEKLCSKLVNISNKHGAVIYCTHSHTLLNPKIIPLNSIYIVEKDKSKKITATLLSQNKTKTESNNAFQPIHEALQISAFQYGTPNDSIIVVEGIYDKYAIELMCELDNVSILPSTSANSIIKNIQFLNAFHKHYIAIWDNDEEGQKQYKEAVKYFGEVESKKFDLLPSLSRNKRRMEEMFEKSDLELIKEELSLDDKASYEKVISSFFFSKEDLKHKILKKISQETKSRFEILKRIIEKRFEYSKIIMKGQNPNVN
jgi:5S rRNA maturation endonuclease (ribonuclease M5)